MMTTTRTAAGNHQPSRFRKFCVASNIYFQLFKYSLTQIYERDVELCDPQQVLRKKLGNELVVLDVTIDKLVKFGDNYSSTIVKAVIDVRYGADGQVEKLHLVAKMLPTAKFVRKFLQGDVIMAKEMFLYEEVLPAYRELSAASGDDFDIAPAFYGGRLTAKPDDEATVVIDDGAVLLLENLRESGYVMEERLKGLTMDHLKIVMPAIAKFHAIGLALKQRNPAFFAKIKEQAKRFELPPGLADMFVSRLLRIIRGNGELRKYYERVKSYGKYDSNGNYSLFEDLDPEHPYACLIHRDLWINNMMFHRDAAGKVDAVKLVDFQVYGISSPMSDLMYFLFTSLPRDFADFDEALTLYRESMCETLTKFDCCVAASLFDARSFERRLKMDAKAELHRCLAMANNIEVRSKWDLLRTSTRALQRMKAILELYDSKGWLDD